MTLWTPIGSELVERVAEPEARLAVPSDVPPDEKVMPPVGVPVPEPGVTFAVSDSGELKAGVVEERDTAVLVAIKAGVLLPEFEPLLPEHPLVRESESRAAIISTVRLNRRRRGNRRINSPERLTMVPAPSH